MGLYSWPHPVSVWVLVLVVPETVNKRRGRFRGSVHLGTLFYFTLVYFYSRLKIIVELTLD